MKLRNIFIAGLSAVALVGCNDYLEVDAPSKNFPEDVFSDSRAMVRALNGVYASMLSSDTYGDKLINNYCLNSDVDFNATSTQYSTSNQYRRFDCDPDGSDLKNTWADLYHGIEVCNLFIEGAEGSPAYDPENPDTDIVQMIGEAKVARAMFYHDLIWMFGDVPFSTKSSQKSETKIYPVTDRIQILDFLINDIADVADNMMDPSQLPEGIERISRQAAYAMIARLAMTAGGWYLAPDGDTYGKMTRAANYLDYYKIARDYAKKVKDSDIHHLNKDYYQVFVDECNNIVANNDDPIFEIPFAKESTGNIGYIHGPRMDQYEGQTPHPYGRIRSTAELNPLYRFMFDEDDTRRDYINQLFRYTATGSEYECRLHTSYTVQNGKWSKLWVNGGLGRITEGNTGINYPYLRYADVLLTLAEAENELNQGPTDLARECMHIVRERAFRFNSDGRGNPLKIDAYPDGGYEEFRKSVLDERKFEFAGENMRWRDLVRNNMYNLEVYWTFFRNLAIAEEGSGSSAYLSIVAERDFGSDEAYDELPYQMTSVRTYRNLDTNTGEKILSTSQFPNSDIEICWIVNPYRRMTSSELNAIKAQHKDIPNANWVGEDYFAWVDGDNEIRDQIRYSLRGYIYMTEMGVLNIVENGNSRIAPEPDLTYKPEDLPVLRYILPYPRTEIARSQGQYVNKYGYR